MVVIYYGLKTETSIIPPLKWPPSRFGRTMHCGWQWFFNVLPLQSIVFHLLYQCRCKFPKLPCFIFWKTSNKKAQIIIIFAILIKIILFLLKWQKELLFDRVTVTTTWHEPAFTHRLSNFWNMKYFVWKHNCLARKARGCCMHIFSSWEMIHDFVAISKVPVCMHGMAVNVW
jgi:hypothetical protein